MKELQLILEILNTLTDEQIEEVEKCREAGWKWAAQYASGKVAAYGHAADMLAVYIHNQIPFETE